MSFTIHANNIGAALLFTLIFSGTFGLMGLIFLIVGLAINGSINRRRSLCTAYAEGTVSAMQAQFGSSGLRAVYSLAIDGKPMQYVSNYAGANNLLVGQSVAVHYDPEHIGRVYIEEDARQMRVFIRVFIILGAVFLGIAAVTALVMAGLA